MNGYYRNSLSGGRLRQCYEIAPPRVQRYLDAEIGYVLRELEEGGRVLELGCGYGRILEVLVPHTACLVGVDTSADSIGAARRELMGSSSCCLAVMDASVLGFGEDSFDAVVCVQNGLSAFRVAPDVVVGESLRVTRSGGIVLFSSYSESFWEERLDWFELQAQYELIGEIDRELTGDGTIVCRDGFRATTIGPDEFDSLLAPLGVEYQVEEVDSSSVFCKIVVP